MDTLLIFVQNRHWMKPRSQMASCSLTHCSPKPLALGRGTTDGIWSAPSLPSTCCWQSTAHRNRGLVLPWIKAESPMELSPDRAEQPSGRSCWAGISRSLSATAISLLPGSSLCKPTAEDLWPQGLADLCYHHQSCSAAFTWPFGNGWGSGHAYLAAPHSFWAPTFADVALTPLGNQKGELTSMDVTRF